ncbi:hypothetical protein [Calothrix sp. PCC 6303]|uniref:hypothetical protein n=1 Tax=Calothrix sp. PCC 6303 TaxID=1170562 RepID=UPI0002A05A34|nr:hypothetical protein [Calothrix sp. PCC 6303]AFZ02032.1 hypothetical protein Cal6303_3086 [Calothrix sp. PCC 6303]
MNFVQNLSIYAAATCFSFAALNLSLVQALVVSRTFTVSDFFLPGIGTIDNIALSYGKSYSGIFTYDDKLFTNSNLKEIPLQSFSFNFLGNTYTERDDVSYPLFPKLNIEDKTNPILNFVINKPGLAANFNSSGLVFGISPFASAGRNESGYSVVDSNGLYTGRVSYGSATPVSIFEPSSIAGIICLTLSGLFLHRQKLQSPATRLKK